MCRMSWNVGASTSWNPQDLSRTVMGLLYLCFTYAHSVLFLGAFAKLRQASISSVMFVRPSSWNNWAPTGRILMQFHILVLFFWKSVYKIRVLLKSDKINRYFTWRTVYIVIITSLLFQLDTLLFSILHLQFFYNFSVHVSDRLVHHQENQITLAASGTFLSFVVISCVAVGANWVTRHQRPRTR